MEQPEFTTDRIPGLRPGEIALDYHCIDEDDDEEQQASTLFCLSSAYLGSSLLAQEEAIIYTYLSRIHVVYIPYLPILDANQTYIALATLRSLVRSLNIYKHKDIYIFL